MKPKSLTFKAWLAEREAARAETWARYQRARALPDAVLVAEAERNARLALGRAIQHAGAHRKYPKHIEGMSTADYVREFERLNNLRPTELELCHG